MSGFCKCINCQFYEDGSCINFFDDIAPEDWDICECFRLSDQGILKSSQDDTSEIIKAVIKKGWFE